MKRQDNVFIHSANKNKTKHKDIHSIYHFETETRTQAGKNEENKQVRQICSCKGMCNWCVWCSTMGCHFILFHSNRVPRIGCCLYQDKIK